MRFSLFGVFNAFLNTCGKKDRIGDKIGLDGAERNQRLQNIDSRGSMHTVREKM